MTANGTRMYEAFAVHDQVPPMVLEAVALAKRFDFAYTVHPTTGRLLASLAGGIRGGIIGETGTRTGQVWRGWSTAPPDTQIVSVELDEDRATATAELFCNDERHDPSR